MFENVVEFIQKTYSTSDFIPLHEPRFVGNQKILMDIVKKLFKEEL